MAFIEARQVSKAFPAASGVHEVLRDVALSVDRGEFVAIVGAMGSGKSTLLNLLAGLLVPDRGTIEVDGAPVRGVRQDAAVVFQSYSLLPWFSALENVRLAVDAAFPRRSKAEQRAQATRMLELVGLASALQRRPGQLSGGMRQRVAIARAFAIEPDLLFLDEPFGALDALTRDALQQELARLCGSTGRPVTTVMITNNVEEAIVLADRIVPLSRGRRATLGASIPVTLQRPRSTARLLHDPAALRVRSTIIEALTEGSGRTMRARPGAATEAEREPGATYDVPLNADRPSLIRAGGQG